MNFPVDSLNKLHVYSMHKNIGVLFIPLPCPGWIELREGCIELGNVAGCWQIGITNCKTKAETAHPLHPAALYEALDGTHLFPWPQSDVEMKHQPPQLLPNTPSPPPYAYHRARDMALDAGSWRKWS